MTEEQKRLYEQMSDRERRSIDALSPENQGPAIDMWAKYQRRQRPGRPVDDDSDRRHP
jgi:hypothetical protein